VSDRTVLLLIIGLVGALSIAFSWFLVDNAKIYLLGIIREMISVQRDVVKNQGEVNEGFAKWHREETQELGEIFTKIYGEVPLRMRRRQPRQAQKARQSPIVTPAPESPAEAEAERAVIRHLQRERPLMLTVGPASPKARRRVGFTKSQRFAIFKRDHYRCQICGSYASDDLTLEVDHKIPVAKGGTNEPENLWTLCFDCNRGKSDSDL
jgi:5-methylcytosine-specific restriction endonuclease McrA